MQALRQLRNGFAGRATGATRRTDSAVRVLLIGDSPRIADAVAPALAADDRLHVVAVAPNARRAERVADVISPDVVVVDAQSPDVKDALDLARGRAPVIPAIVIGCPRAGDEAPTGSAFISEACPADALSECVFLAACLGSAFASGSTRREQGARRLRPR